MTLIGVKIRQKPVKQMLIESLTMLADFSKDIGHSKGQDVNKKVREPRQQT